MTNLVSLERAKSALRIDGADLDADLMMMIGAASEVLAGYAKNPDWLEDVYEDTGGNIEGVPERFQIACIALVGSYLREIDGDEQKAFSQNNLPWFVTAILAGDRTPTLA